VAAGWISNGLPGVQPKGVINFAFALEEGLGMAAEDDGEGKGQEPKAGGAPEAAPKLSGGGIVVIAIAGVCFFTGLGLLLTRVLGPFPGITAIFIAFPWGVAFAAATFGFLGGVRDATFEAGKLLSPMGAFKMGGSSAVGLAVITAITILGDTEFKDPGISQVDNLRSQITKLRSDLDGKDKALKDTAAKSDEVAKGATTEAIVKRVHDEKRTGPLGGPLFAMSREHLGPWSSTRLVVSVIDAVPNHTYRYCPIDGLAGQKLRLVAIYDNNSGQSYQTDVDNGSNSVVTCSDRKEGEKHFDIQISCQDGAILFPDDVDCGPNNRVLWRQREYDGHILKGFRLQEVVVDDL
jgi:hypothetical protein